MLKLSTRDIECSICRVDYRSHHSKLNTIRLRKHFWMPKKELKLLYLAKETLIKNNLRILNVRVFFKILIIFRSALLRIARYLPIINSTKRNTISNFSNILGDERSMRRTPLNHNHGKLLLSSQYLYILASVIFFPHPFRIHQ